MAFVQKTSNHVPLAAAAGRLLFEASRRAEAMGLLAKSEAGGAADTADLGSVRQLAARIRQAGIAGAASAALHNVDAPSASDIADLLRMMIAALEASPVPAFEWAGLGRVLDSEKLASLLAVSISSLNRYQAGERETPDAIAARLHFLALVVGDLSGSYNEIGIRRWFDRKRSALAGRSPAQVLSGEWDPDDPGPSRVRLLARELVTLS